MKKVLIVDDSALMRRVLSDIINDDEQLIVEKTANNGLEALNVLQGVLHHTRRRVRIILEIIPEYTRLHTHMHDIKIRKHHVERLLQFLRLDLLGQCCRDPVDIA